MNKIYCMILIVFSTMQVAIIASDKNNSNDKHNQKISNLYTKIRFHLYPHKGENESQQDYMNRLEKEFSGYTREDYNQSFRPEHLAADRQYDVGLRPLHVAIKSGSHDLIPFLTLKGVDVNAGRDRDKLTKDYPLDLFDTTIDPKIFRSEKSEERKKRFEENQMYRKLLIENGAKYSKYMQNRIERAGLGGLPFAEATPHYSR